MIKDLFQNLVFSVSKKEMKTNRSLRSQTKKIMRILEKINGVNQASNPQLNKGVKNEKN